MIGVFEDNSYVVGDVRELLRQLPDSSIDCVVTSPPYYGLRDYGIEPSVLGCKGDCEHRWGAEKIVRKGGAHGNGVMLGGGRSVVDAQDSVKDMRAGRFCEDCGAWLGCLGLEPTLWLYIEHMVDVFREVRRVLKPEGTVWLNLGDTYAGSQSGLKPKDLMMAPHRVAIALQEDGWWVRMDVVWSKTTAMPESVVDRPTKAHEYVFLLSKSADYYYDAEAIKEPASTGTHSRGAGICPKAGKNEKSVDHRKHGFNKRWRTKQNVSFQASTSGHVELRNKRSVWPIAGEPTREAHFATMPTKLVHPCILAGCPSGGVVLDPFGGSGTVGRVAEDLGRKWILFDRSSEYAAIAKRRTAQTGLLGRCR